MVETPENTVGVTFGCRGVYRFFALHARSRLFIYFFDVRLFACLCTSCSKCTLCTSFYCSLLCTLYTCLCTARVLSGTIRVLFVTRESRYARVGKTLKNKFSSTTLYHVNRYASVENGLESLSNVKQTVFWLSIR